MLMSVRQGSLFVRTDRCLTVYQEVCVCVCTHVWLSECLSTCVWVHVCVGETEKKRENEWYRLTSNALEWLESIEDTIFQGQESKQLCLHKSTRFGSKPTCPQNQDLREVTCKLPPYRCYLPQNENSANVWEPHRKAKRSPGNSREQRQCWIPATWSIQPAEKILPGNTCRYNNQTHVKIRKAWNKGNILIPEMRMKFITGTLHSYLHMIGSFGNPPEYKCRVGDLGFGDSWGLQ